VKEGKLLLKHTYGIKYEGDQALKEAIWTKSSTEEGIGQINKEEGNLSAPI